MKTQDIAPKGHNKTPKKKKNETKQNDKPPHLQDLFTKNQEIHTHLQLMEEHLTQIDAMRKTHEARLQAIREQVQLELFKIWNDMWLQKKAVFAKAHKEFLKVLAA